MEYAAYSFAASIAALEVSHPSLGARCPALTAPGSRASTDIARSDCPVPHVGQRCRVLPVNVPSDVGAPVPLPRRLSSARRHPQVDPLACSPVSLKLRETCGVFGCSSARYTIAAMQHHSGSGLSRTRSAPLGRDDDVAHLAGLRIMCRSPRLDCRLDRRQVTDRSVLFGHGCARGHLPPTDISSK